MRSMLLPLLLICSVPAVCQIDSALLIAIKKCDPAVVRQRVDSHINLNATDQNGANALMWAVYYCDLPLIRYLVQHGAKPPASGAIYVKGYYGSLQEIAIKRGKMELWQYVIDSLALSPAEKAKNYYTGKKDSWSPLSHAIIFGRADIAKDIMRRGVPVDEADWEEFAIPVITAAEHDKWDMFHMLLQTSAYKQRFHNSDSLVKMATRFSRPFSTTMEKELQLQLFLLSMRNIYFGSESIGFARALTKVAMAYNEIGEYSEAKSWILRAMSILERLGQKRSCSYATCLNHLAVICYNTAKYEQAIPFLTQAKEIIDSIYTQPVWARAFNSNLFGINYTRMGRYDEALRHYRYSLAICAQSMGYNSEFYAYVANNMAFAYTSLGMHHEALSLYQIGLDSKKEIGEDHQGYGGNLLDIGYAYNLLGQYHHALPSYEKAGTIVKKWFGDKHQYYVMAVEGKAVVYQNIGQVDKALALYKEAYDIYKNAFGPDHPYCGSTLSNLAMLYESTGRFAEAFSCYRQALAVRERTLKPDHPDLAQSFMALGAAYIHKKNYDSAFQLYQQALLLIESSVGKEHQYYANCLVGIASLHEHRGKVDSALTLYRQAFDLTQKVLGKDYAGNIDIAIRLALLYDGLGMYADADDLLIEACRLQLKHLTDTYITLSEKEKMVFLNKAANRFYFLPSMLYRRRGSNPLLLQQLYRNELTLKGMVLEQQQQILQSIRNNGDSMVLQLYDQWQFNRFFLGKQSLLPIRQRVAFYDSLQNQVNLQEQQLSRVSASFNKEHTRQSITLSDISKQLRKGEATIEFIRFPLYNQQWTDSVMYAALVLLPGDTLPAFIPLFEEKQLQRLLRPHDKGDLVERLYGTNRRANRWSDSLYQLVWRPIEAHLANVHTVYHAPAGLLHRVAFQAIRVNDNDFLIDKYRLNHVLSTKSVIFSRPPNTKPLSGLVLGDIEYNLKTKAKPPGHAGASMGSRGLTDTAAALFNFFNAGTRGSRDGSWVTLPSTKKEMDSIRHVLSGSQVQVITLSGEFATEEAIKKLNGSSPQLLHMATHGYFLQAREQRTNEYSHAGANTFTVQQNPLFRSGMILAGGNHAWQGKPAIGGREDGILTAYEISQMDLSNTSLVVLSACETALGELEANEGVLGLQRAFKMAGVRQLVVSLWNVYDEPTMKLMTLFYKNLLTGLTATEAMRAAQLAIKEKYRDPHFWAGFVVIE